MRMKIIGRWIFGLLLSIPLTSLASDVPQRWAALAEPVFFNYSVQQGLPAGNIWGLAEDKQGFLWLASGSGLLRWDGYLFERVVAGLNDVDTDLRSLISDSEGMLWLGTGQGLVRFDPQRRVFSRIDLGSDTAVLSIAFETTSSGQVLWLGTEGGVLQLYSADMQISRHLQALANSDPTLRVFAVMKAVDGSIWAGTSAGLYRKMPEANHFSVFNLDPALPPDTRISGLLQAADHRIWVITPYNGAWVIDTSFTVVQAVIPDFDREWIYSISEVEPGVIWLGTYGRGIIELGLQSESVRRIQHNRLLSSSLAHDEVASLYRSRSGLVLAGTARGLSVYDPVQAALLSIPGDIDAEVGIRDTQIESVLSTSDGNLWLGLLAKGVDVLDPSRGRIASYEVNPQLPGTALPGGAIEALAELSGGEVFIGSNWGLYSAQGSELVRLTPAGRPANRYTGSLASEGTRLWIGGTDGLWRLPMDSKALAIQPVPGDGQAALTDHRVSVLLAGAGELVVGTWDGVNWISPDGQLVYRIPTTADIPSPFANNYVTALLRDSVGRLWIGTSGAGIYIGAEAGQPTSFHHISLAEGLSSAIVSSLQADEEGRIWVSGSDGIAFIDETTLAVTPLVLADGARFSPYSRRAGTRTSMGEIVFGGDGGLTVIRPWLWKSQMPDPPLVFSSLRVGGVLSTALLASVSEAQPLQIPADANALTVEFAALDFLAADTIKYRYRLKGFDDQWHFADSRHRQANFTGLPPGHYLLIVQSSDRHGHWREPSLALAFSVQPYWYQTLWAKVLYLALLAGIVLLMVKWRTNRLRHRQLLLEQCIQERTQALQATTQALREKSDALEQASLTDPLTGISNRRFLEKHINTDISLCQRRYRDALRHTVDVDHADLILYLLDIDLFKNINDHHGHSVGDLVLVEISQRLKNVARDADYLVRWGGEEFMLVARATHRRHAADLAERIRTQICSRPFDIGPSDQLHVTCSIGFVPIPLCVERPDALGWNEYIRLADQALYTAKHAGRNAWVGIFAGSQLDTSTELSGLSDNLAQNIANGLLLLSSNLPDADVCAIWPSSAHS